MLRVLVVLLGFACTQVLADGLACVPLLPLKEQKSRRQRGVNPRFADVLKENCPRLIRNRHAINGGAARRAKADAQGQGTAAGLTTVQVGEDTIGTASVLLQLIGSVAGGAGDVHG